MNKMPLLIILYSVTCLLSGLSSLLGIGTLVHPGFHSLIPAYITKAIFGILLIVSGYYLLRRDILGWKLSVFTQLLCVSKAYVAIIYLFINISSVNFTTENVNEYILIYALQALIGMGIIYYLLSINITQYFNIHQTVKTKVLKMAFPIVCSIVLFQIATHTVML